MKERASTSVQTRVKPLSTRTPTDTHIAIRTRKHWSAGRPVTEAELENYFSRMTAVPEIGTRGLHNLRSANVTVVGVGGVGSSISYYLAQSGIGHLRLIDQDIVEPSNLHRLQGLDQSDLYHPKAEALADSLHRLVPSSRFEAIVDTLREANVSELLGGSDVIVDGLDNFRTRFILNRHSEIGRAHV